MKRANQFAVHAGACLAVVMLAAGLNGEDPFNVPVLLLGLALGVYSAGLEAGWRLPRLVWQSPLLFRNAGLFLKCGDRRWRLVHIPDRRR